MPKFMFTGAVWWYTRLLPQYWLSRLTSRYQLGTLPVRALSLASARGPMVKGPRPGGQLRPFWLQL